MISRKIGTMIFAGVLLVVAGIIVTSILLATRPSFIQINDGTFKIIELPYTYTRNHAYVLVVSSAIGGMMLSYTYGNRLNGVSAASTSDVWAVGWYNNKGAIQTLIERYTVP